MMTEVQRNGRQIEGMLQIQAKKVKLHQMYTSNMELASAHYRIEIKN